MSILAINGGPKIRTELFPSQNTFNNHEIAAAMNVISSGRLSHYRANWTSDFYGGPRIKQLEKDWSKKFGSKYSIAVNSATSGLIAACGAIGLQPGDEVIVTPWSMTCSATVPLIFGALPVFADIEEDYFCLDPEDIKRKITKKTKAIIVVSLFGQPYNQEINDVAKEHGLYVIEDAAQAPGAMYKDKYTGTLADIGVFSFNYGKHINSGEGGMITTDNIDLEIKCRLFMNHGEAVLNDISECDASTLNWGTGIQNLVGFNFRMTELTAAVVIEQLKKFDDLLEKRLKNVEYLDSDMLDIPSIKLGQTRLNCTHSYYVLPYIWIDTKLYRDKYIKAVKSELMPRKDRDTEGVPIGCGYIKPIYLMPLFQTGKHWALKNTSQKYKKGLCPVAEDLWENKLFLTLLHAPNSTIEDIGDVSRAFIKVWENKNEIL